ncbi:hypothetical protein MTR_5g014000 [Medicago truncatula]|uniref:Uncharacterized protein n=1 Tax=Medicago truncatula TaxID=3880 RepID=G7JZU0_MEDTR|nr:hypothetical protein MTR_5g014000 [Medicago truncatula]
MDMVEGFVFYTFIFFGLHHHLHLLYNPSLLKLFQSQASGTGFAIKEFQYTNQAELEHDSRFTVSTTIGTRFCDFEVEEELEKDNN